MKTHYIDLLNIVNRLIMSIRGLLNYYIVIHGINCYYKYMSKNIVNEPQPKVTRKAHNKKTNVNNITRTRPELYIFRFFGASFILIFNTPNRSRVLPAKKNKEKTFSWNNFIR